MRGCPIPLPAKASQLPGAISVMASWTNERGRRRGADGLTTEQLLALVLREQEEIKQRVRFVEDTLASIRRDDFDELEGGRP